MAITKPPVIPSWAEAGDKVQPSNAEIQAGWPLSSIPPSRQRFNWLLNFLANGIRYFTRRGLPDYDAAETYMTGDRIIGDDGKTYRSLIDNNTAQTPSTSPTNWERWGFTFDEFLAGVATPPQFDNDTSLATTAFVQRALGNLQNVIGLNSSATLVAADAGKLVNLFGVAGGVITMPSSASVPVGAAFEFFSSCTQAFVVQRSGSDVIYVSSDVTSFVLNSGDTLRVVNLGAGIWVATFSSAQIKYSPKFAASLTAAGCQKLPSGLIIQWASGSNQATAGNQTITLPIAFPTAHLRSLVTNIYAASAQNGGYGFISATTSQVTVARNNADTTNGVTPLIFSIGY